VLNTPREWHFGDTAWSPPSDISHTHSAANRTRAATGAYIGVVGEDRPSPQRGAFAQLAACIRQDKTRQLEERAPLLEATGCCGAPWRPKVGKCAQVQTRVCVPSPPPPLPLSTRSLPPPSPPLLLPLFPPSPPFFLSSLFLSAVAPRMAPV
jgi:hypothetical protein